MGFLTSCYCLNTHTLPFYFSSLYHINPYLSYDIDLTREVLQSILTSLLRPIVNSVHQPYTSLLTFLLFLTPPGHPTQSATFNLPFPLPSVISYLNVYVRDLSPTTSSFRSRRHLNNTLKCARENGVQGEDVLLQLLLWTYLCTCRVSCLRPYTIREVFVIKKNDFE